MFVLDQITVNLNNPGQRQRIYASVGDSGTRAVEVKLITDDGDWLIPEGVSCVIRFVKADGHQGVYYTLPDGSNAWDARGSVLTVGIAAQVLTCPGVVAVSAQLLRGTERLGVFGFDIHVVHDPSAVLEESSDYFSIEDLVEINATIAGLISDMGEKAPAGYGLGGTNGAVVTDANNATNNGWYTVFNGGSNLPGASYGGSIHVKAYPSGNIIQHLYYTGHGGGECRRMCADGVWGMWEYITPPLYVGLEYRTTERWQSKAVYTKLVSFGLLPNNDKKSIAHGCEATQVIRCCGQNITTGENIPMYYGAQNIKVYASKTNVWVTTDYDADANNAYVQIWYTKN